MCRAHKIITTGTVILWTVVLILMFGVQPESGPWRVAMILLGCLASVLVPYCLWPWMVRDMMAQQIKDVQGAFLSGWEAAKEPEDREPRRLRPVG